MTIKLLDNNDNIILERPFKLGYVNIIPLEKVEAELLTSWKIYDELGNCLLSYWYTFKYASEPYNLVVSLTPDQTQRAQVALREGKGKDISLRVSAVDEATPLVNELHRVIDDLFPLHPKQAKIIKGTKAPLGTENISWYQTK